MGSAGRIGDRPLTGRKVPDVLAGATRVFLDRGYAASSMDEVAQAAQVSKRTLYQYYPSKEALFIAVIERRALDLVQFIDDRAMPSDSGQLSLIALARALLERAISEETTQLYRIVIAETGRLPDLGKALIDVALNATLREIESVIQRVAAERGVRLEDPAYAADVFLSILYGVEQIRVLMGGSLNEERDRAIGTLGQRIATFERAFGLDVAPKTEGGRTKAKTR